MTQASPENSKGQYVQFPVHLIYGCPGLTRDDRWVLLSIMGKCWDTGTGESGPHRLSYREIAKLSGTPLSLLVSFTDKKTDRPHEGIIDRIARVTGYLRIVTGKAVDPVTGKPCKQEQTYIYINYARMWEDSRTFYQERHPRADIYRVEETDYQPSVSYTNTSQSIGHGKSVSYTNASVHPEQKSVSYTNGSVSHTNKSVSVSRSKHPPIDYLDITDKKITEESGESDALHAYTPPTPTFSSGEYHATTDTPAPAQLDTAPADMDSRHPLPATTPVSENENYSHSVSQAEPSAYSQPSMQSEPVAAVPIRNTSSIDATTARLEALVGMLLSGDAAEQVETLAALHEADPQTYPAPDGQCSARAALAADVCALAEFSTGDVDNNGDEETVKGAALGEARPRLRKTVLRPVGGAQAAGVSPVVTPCAAGSAEHGGAQAMNAVRVTPPDNAVLIDTGKQVAVSAEPEQGASKGRRAQGESRGKSRKKAAPTAEDAPPPLTFTAQGQALWDAWASIFKTAPTPTKSDIAAANDLAPKIAVWAGELALSRRDVLNKIRGWLHARDKTGYYEERGVKLFDVSREFGGWQEAAERKLEQTRRASAPLYNAYDRPAQTIYSIPLMPSDEELRRMPV